MVEQIDRAKNEGDSLGGVLKYTCKEPRQDSAAMFTGTGGWTALAGALMSIPAIKGVEIGLGFDAAARKGSETHDELFLDEKGRITRATNRRRRAGGGITNGETIVLRAAMKPIPTLMKPLSSVDLYSFP